MAMIKIWDNHNKQWLEPMAIYFDDSNNIRMVDAIVPGDKPLKNGWYKIQGDDLNKIAIIGEINFNTKLIPIELKPKRKKK